MSTSILPQNLFVVKMLNKSNFLKNICYNNSINAYNFIFI